MAVDPLTYQGLCLEKPVIRPSALDRHYCTVRHRRQGACFWARLALCLSVPLGEQPQCRICTACSSPCSWSTQPSGGSAAPHAHRLPADTEKAATLCAGTGLIPPTSAPGLGSPRPHLRRDWARTCHIRLPGTNHRPDMWHTTYIQRSRTAYGSQCRIGNRVGLCRTSTWRTLKGGCRSIRSTRPCSRAASALRCILHLGATVGAARWRPGGTAGAAESPNGAE